MDFFARQDQARRHTKWLVGYFILAILLMTLAIYLVFALLFLHDRYEPDTWRWLWHGQLFAAVSLGTLLVVFIGSASKIHALRQGGGAVAMQLGGVPLDPNSSDPDQRRLLNVIEEMALASGTAVPDVYLLPKESGINAFAAGHQPRDAAIAVTRGCMTQLTRDELQGVLGHEFSHILNGDMRLNLRLMGLVYGILCLAFIGRVLLRTRGKRNPLPVIGLGLLVIGMIGVFFGRLIKSAVCRQREFLADAASVQFTRNPAGLAGALKKIGGLAGGSRLATPNAEEASHFFFCNGLAESWLTLLATHPPLVERIRLLDPAFDGTFPPILAPVEPPPISPKAGWHARHPELGPMGQFPFPVGAGRGEGEMALSSPAASTADAPVRAAPVKAEQVIPSVGAPTPIHLQYAAELRAALPQDLIEVAREPLGAVALTYAFLLSDAAAVRDAQLKQLEPETQPGICREVRRLAPAAAALSPAMKLHLALLSMPALSRLSVKQFEQFCKSIGGLVECDQEIDLFEYTLEKIVLRRLEPRYHPAKPPVIQYYSLKPLLPDCAVLLSAVARLATSAPDAPQHAFQEGALRLYAGPDAVQLLDPGQCALEHVDAALDRLALAAPAIKRKVLDACAYAIAADGLIQADEAELLRAIAETLDCPIPPFLADL